MRRLKAIPLLGIILLAANPAFAEAPSLPVRIDLAAGRPVVLESWRYRGGDQAEWARPDLDDSDWTVVGRSGREVRPRLKGESK